MIFIRVRNEWIFGNVRDNEYKGISASSLVQGIILETTNSDSIR